MRNFELSWATLILAIVVVVLTLIIILMIRSAREWRKSHEEKMRILRQTIVVLLNHGDQQSNKVELNKELEQRLRAATQILSRDIFATLKECIEKLSEDDLLTKL